MKFGVSLFPTDTSARPDVVAREAENRGFHAFWVSEHSHACQHPVSMADTVPREYSSMLDPFVALSSAAGATTRILLGTAIVILPQHDPINCAKAVATLDLVSGGRVLFGIGAGWNEPELRNHRTEPSTRFRLMRERVEAMKALWTNEVAGYDGEFVRIEPSWQWPKPVQKPHPPIFVAGASPNVIRRVAGYGDGWLPVVVPQASDITPGRMTPLAELRDMVPRMRELAAEKGRPAPRVVVSGYFDAEAHAVYEALGVESLTFRLPSADFDTVRQAMDAAQAQLKEAGISLT